MMNLQDLQKKIEEEFTPNLNPILEEEFSKLEFGDEIFFSNVTNIRLTEYGDYCFDISVPYRKYYLRCHCSTSKKPCITSIEYLPGMSIYLNVTSKTLTYSQLSSKLSMTPSSGWDIGDKFKGGKLSRKFSSVKYKASIRDYVPIDIALIDFVSDLVVNASEINALSKIADVKLSLVRWSHISKVDGLNFHKDFFDKMSQLAISLDYDAYVYHD